MTLHQRQVLDHVEARHDHLSRAEADRSGHQQIQGIDVEERQDIEEYVVASHRDTGEELLLIRGQVAVREHHALREARGAAGVRQCGQIVHRGLHRRCRAVLGHERVEAFDAVRG